MSSPTEPCSGVIARNPDHTAEELLAEATKAFAPAKELVLPIVQELDLLRYAVLFERHQRLHVEYELAQTRVAMAAQQQKANGDELGALLDALGTKYNVDFHKHRIQLDGTIVPLEPR